jgi:retron-type reverse transcriptase
VIGRAWLAIQRNARTSKSVQTKKEVDEFAVNSATNLRRIRDQLQKNKFVFPPAHGVKLPKGKSIKSDFRPLVVAKVEARIVQRAIHDVLVTVPAIQKYVRTPYSFGGIKKGDDEQMAAVPAAIHAVLAAISGGALFVIRSDISGFFTKIPKSVVTGMVAGCVKDPTFVNLFSRAIAVELDNMAQLRGHANAFPIEDIGVAQGNSLSPLLGNLLLYEFDAALNSQPDVRCIRYIDDFIILAPNRNVGENAFSKAKHLLHGLGMTVSNSKTIKKSVHENFEFLGIEFSDGWIRPSRDARARLLQSLQTVMNESRCSFRQFRKSGLLDASASVLETLGKVSGILQGWGKHYRFCNDINCFEYLDTKAGLMIGQYLAAYREAREKVGQPQRWRLLGIEPLAQMERAPFTWKWAVNSE